MSEQQLGPLAVSVDEAARLLAVSRDLVYDLVATGELVSVRLGRRTVIPVIALQELIATGRGSPDETS